MAVYSFNPLEDSRWAEFVERHPHASIFHTTGWLRALRLTYGYEPVVFTTSLPGATLANGIVFCEIKSWLTGRRLVSLPFADHCEPLVSSAEEADEICAFLRGSVEEQKWKYVEVRPRNSVSQILQHGSREKANSFSFHAIDLTPELDTLFNKLHKSSIQRMIRRAERLGLSCECGCSEALLQKFYALLLKTRRRHNLPPQPISWFRNLISCLGDRVEIRIAVHEGKALGGILTIFHNGTLVYKYGASDEMYHHCGSMPFLFWSAIREAKQTGFAEFDLGRSDLENSGLITFKDRLGARASVLQYVRLSCSENGSSERAVHLAKRVFACMPDGVLTAAGKLLYRHIG